MNDGWFPQRSRRGIGGLLKDTFRHYGKDFGALFTASACVLIPYFVLDLLFNRQTAGAEQLTLAKLQKVTSLQQLVHLEQQAGVAPSAMTWVLMLLNLLVVTPLLFGIVVQLVLHTADGGSGGIQRVPAMFSHAFQRIGRAIATLILGLLLVLFVCIAGSAVIGMVVAVLSAAGMPGSTVAGLTVVLVLVLICVLVWVGVKLTALVPVVYAENLSGVSALSRSAALSRGRSWYIIGFGISLYLMTAVIKLVLAGLITVFVTNLAAATIVSDVLQLFVLPFLLVGMTMLYADLASRITPGRS